MKYPWFKKLGWFYLPVSVPAVIILIMFLVFCVQVFIAIDRHSHSVSNTLYGVFPFIVPAFLVYIWMAKESSNDSANKNPD
jgi:drug/metabolite transporter (DMT)-like permease